jgi:hypothetical protein
MIAQGLIVSDRKKGVMLTAAGDDLLLMMRSIASVTEDTRYKDVGARIRKRYNGRLEMQRRKYHEKRGSGRPEEGADSE